LTFESAGKIRKETRKKRIRRNVVMRSLTRIVAQNLKKWGADPLIVRQIRQVGRGLRQHGMDRVSLARLARMSEDKQCWGGLIM